MLCNWKYIRGRVRFFIAVLLVVQSTVLPGITPVFADEVSSLIVVNEFSANGSNDWVELYNPGSLALSVDGWKLRDSTETNKKELTGGIEAHGFLVVEFSNFLNVNTDSIRVMNEVDEVVSTITYTQTGAIPYPAQGQSTARVTDGGASWASGLPTKGYSNVEVPPDQQSPSVPVGGVPHLAVKNLQTQLTWTASTDDQSEVRYQVRAARDDGSGVITDATAWHSAWVSSPVMEASLIEGVSDGVWLWQARAGDEAENVSLWSETWRVAFDSILPLITIDSPVEGGLLGGTDSQLVIEARAEDTHMRSLAVYVDATDITSQLQATVGSGTISVSGVFDGAGLASGAHTLRVVASDEAENVAEASREFTVDMAAPVLTTELADELRIASKLNITLTADEAHPQFYEIRVLDSSGQAVLSDGQPLDIADSNNTSNSIVYEFDTKKVPNGAYVVYFMGRDAAGNESELRRRVTVVNVLVGMGSVKSTGEELLDQYSVSLSQPFVTPRIVTAPQRSLAVISGGAPVIQDDLLENKSAPVSDTPVVSATEQGWRLMGVLWYWWVALSAVLGFAGYRLVRFLPVILRR